MDTQLDHEMAILLKKDLRLAGDMIETVEWVNQQGWTAAARRITVARLNRLLWLTESGTPESHEVLRKLLAIKAVEVIENGAWAERDDRTHLFWCYRHLPTEQLEWAREQLQPPGVQLRLLLLPQSPF